MINAKKIFIVAGEASGDMHGAKLISDIKCLNPNIDFYGIGGDRMKDQGLRILYNYSKVNYIGFSAVLKNFYQIRKILFSTIDYAKEIEPDIIILIDFPGFNLKFAEIIRNSFKGKIIYYISPQVWAWHKSRVQIIKKNIDKMLVIFPFEVEFYKNEKITATYVPHPFLRTIDDFKLNHKKVSTERKQICLLPGSRLEEIKRILPVLVSSSNRLIKDYNTEVNLIYPTNIDKSFYSRYLKNSKINLIPNIGIANLIAIYNSDLVITKFGTTTFESALLGTPFISVYKAGLMNYLIVKQLATTKYVAMPNILLKREVVKEFLQKKLNPNNIYNECKNILFNKDYREKMLNSFKEMRILFDNCETDKSAAEIIINS